MTDSSEGDDDDDEVDEDSDDSEVEAVVAKSASGYSTPPCEPQLPVPAGKSVASPPVALGALLEPGAKWHESLSEEEAEEEEEEEVADHLGELPSRSGLSKRQKQRQRRQARQKLSPWPAPTPPQAVPPEPGGQLPGEGFFVKMAHMLGKPDKIAECRRIWQLAEAGVTVAQMAEAGVTQPQDIEAFACEIMDSRGAASSSG